MRGGAGLFVLLFGSYDDLVDKIGINIIDLMRFLKFRSLKFAAPQEAPWWRMRIRSDDGGAAYKGERDF